MEVKEGTACTSQAVGTPQIPYWKPSVASLPTERALRDDCARDQGVMVTIKICWDVVLVAARRKGGGKAKKQRKIGDNGIRRGNYLGWHCTITSGHPAASRA